MSTRHTNLLKAAKDAIDAVASDRTVALLRVADSLEELSEHIGPRLFAVRQDIEEIGDED